jgi:hypothetical protein
LGSFVKPIAFALDSDDGVQLIGGGLAVEPGRHHSAADKGLGVSHEENFFNFKSHLASRYVQQPEARRRGPSGVGNRIMRAYLAGRCKRLLCIHFDRAIEQFVWNQVQRPDAD